VVLIGIATGDFPAIALVSVLPIAFLSSLLFAGLGLTVAARARSIDEISYPQYLLIFPMFLFCGVFYPVEQLPTALQWAAWALPLTSVNSLMRTLTLGFPFRAWSVFIFAAWLVLLVVLGHRSMRARLVK
jgi:lipooligosaccharide transport system permease protein